VSSSPGYLPSVDNSSSISRIGIRGIEPENIYCLLNNLTVAFTAVGIANGGAGQPGFLLCVVCETWKAPLTRL
jgi:hypothetical protein